MVVPAVNTTLDVLSSHLAHTLPNALPFGHGPDWRSRPIDRVIQCHPSTDRPLLLGAIGRGDQTKPPRLPATSWTTSRRIPRDLCGPSQPFRPERIKPAVSTLATHPPPSTQSLSLPCPALTVPCPVPSCPALPCPASDSEPQRATAIPACLGSADSPRE